MPRGEHGQTREQNKMRGASKGIRLEEKKKKKTESICFQKEKWTIDGDTSTGSENRIPRFVE